MLQPRSCRIACLLLVVLVTALAEDPLQDEDAKERFKRENGDVTVLSLEEIARLREAPPVGVLSSTARTFVTGGATTEYATQILGTTVGRTYARLLSTGSRVFYDNAKPSKDTTPFLVFPTLPALLQPTVVEQSPVQPTQATVLEEPIDSVTVAALLNEIAGNPEQTTTPPKPVVSVRKEFSVKRNTISEVKPAKVKPSADLPTVTIKAEFAPSGYSDSLEERKEKKLRAGKGLFRGGVQIKNEFQKYDTVTYVGFADFTTTVGNTVIVFMPKTAIAANAPVTSISGAATLRPEDAVAPVVTTVKTFLSHSPGMATKTVTGHNLDVQTTLPTVQADRASKAYNPVYVTTEEMDEMTERGTTPVKVAITEKALVTEDVMTDVMTERTTGFSTDPEPKTDESELVTSPKYEHPTTELSSTEAEDFSTPEGSEVELPHEELVATESLRITPTFATTSTQVFIPGDKPLGLAKSISVVEANDETTTHFTSFLFGTIVDGEYTQLTQVVSSVASPSSIAPTPVFTNLVNTMMSPETTEMPTGSAETTTDEKEDGTEEPTSHPVKLITKLVPATVHQTYTYLTTFFVPQGDTTTTSVRTREVVSDEIRYVATVIPENQITPSSETISPTDVTQSYQTSTPLEPTTEEITEQPTPQLPDTTLSAVTQEITSPKAEESSTTAEGTTIEPDPITPTPENTSASEEEVEVIIRTLYTTYTYLTTFFQETTTSVQSRKVVETNVVTSTLDTASIPEATDPAVAGLFNPTSSSTFSETSSASQANVVERPPSEDTFLKTYTYYTTVFVDGETIVESETKVVEETIQPTSTTRQIYKTASSDDNSVIPKDLNDLEASEDRSNRKKKPTYGTISRSTAADTPTSEALVMPHPLQSSIDDAYSYDTTMSSADRAASTKTTEDADETELLQAREEELKKEAMLAMGMTTTTEDEFVETMVTDITSSSSGGSRRKAFEEYETDPNDQISSESNTEEIEPSFSPTILLQTSYTTFTYFTTVYKGPSSDIISRLETVTNVVTETVKPTEIEPNLSPEEATLPITYFTTFTYWTTLYRGKNTMITSREETVSNVVTPTLDSEYNSLIEMTESPISPTSSVETIAPTVPADASVFTVAAMPTEIIATPIESSTDQPEEPTDMVLEPTTYYTTFTYFTTSYIGNETVINSHLETETNVETPTKSVPLEATESVSTSQIDVVEATPALASASPSLQPTGLISTIRSSEVNEGITTLLNTDVYGTYIDGLYAQVLESSSEIVAPSQASTIDSLHPTGIVSINEGKIVDANGVTTTLFTTKAIGTYIDALYAQVLESTTSVVVDEAKKTDLPTDVESTTVIGSKVFTTGLVRLIEGSIVKDHTTTYYESRVIGTLIDGRYAQIIESTSSFKADVTPTAGISPSSTVPPASEISPTLSVTTSSPAVIEGSQGGEDEEDSDEDDQDSGKSRLGFQSKKKTFTPVIRPFSSRPRPTFQPKKKTGDPATTITRTSFTPTVTATPASKTGFGSSRNRFAANRSKGSSNSQLEIKPTASSSRRFSRPRSSSNAAASFGGSSSSQTFGRGRSSARVQPTATVSIPPRRGGFSYRSSGRPNVALSTSARGRIGPTRANPFNRFASTTPVEDININDITGVAATEEVEHNTASEEEEEEAVTSAPTTTTESPRRAGNPLLRFRRPPILQRSQTTTSTTPKPSTTPKRQSPSLLRRPDSRSGVPGTTTPRSRPTVNFNRIKPRPASSLFPPRGLAKKPTQEEVEEEKDEQGNSEEVGEEDIEDNEYEGSETAEQTSSTTTEAPKNNRRSKALGSVIPIRPFTRRPRAKRQADHGGRTYSARYRRPVSRVSNDYEEDDYSPEPVKEVPTRPPTSRGYRSRNQQVQPRDHPREVQTPQPRVRASPVPSTPRHQFTLRERTSQPQTTTSPTRSNFRRPTSSPRRRLSQELTTQSQRLSKPVTRHRTVTTEAPTAYTRGTSRRYNSQQTSRRTTARSRYRDNTDFDTYSPKPFDGTITVTHKVPTEVTIPVVNGKNTEYKPIITAKPSLEVLGPYQYTNTIGKDGKPTIILNSDITSTLPSGFMEVTKFLVFETPTTSVTFTPTTLRGRKTSFSHIVPSTVYEVRHEVSTIQPNLGDNPLANILLSQLLLGNLAQPTVAGQPQTPITEYKTKTTTYVTTVTSHTSTILPLTFRGKEITTTIVDSSVQVITATEYLTETVVITPTAVLQPAINNQLNTLLLPALLQAQLLNQKTPNPLLRKPPIDDLYNNDRPLDEEDPQQRYNRQKDEVIDDDRKVRESVESEQDVEQKPARKKSKIRLKEKDKESSVITLYVSGKHPGEFTTLLSTVPVSEESSGNLKKREISLASFNLEEFRIQASKTPELGSSFTDDISNYISPVGDGVRIESSEVETVSGESEVGEFSRYLDLSKSIHPEIVSKASSEETLESRTGHFLLVGHADSAPNQRKAISRSSPFPQRRKRDTTPGRRVIRVRVPRKKVQQFTPVESDFDEEMASSHNEQILRDDVPLTTEEPERKVKKVLVARRRQQEPPPELKRKRIVIMRKHPIHDEPAAVEPSEYGETVVPTATRRRVLKTKKRLIAVEPDQIEETDVLPRKRITVTRKRVIQTDTTNYGENDEMQTLYNYQYSIPGDGGSSVMVTQLYMTGDKETSDMNNDADFKELMESVQENQGVDQGSQQDSQSYENNQSLDSAKDNEEMNLGSVDGTFEGYSSTDRYVQNFEKEQGERDGNEETQLEKQEIGDQEVQEGEEDLNAPEEEETTSLYTPSEYDYYDDGEVVDENQETNTADDASYSEELGDFELDPTYVTLFPYDTTDASSTTEPVAVTEASTESLELDPTFVTIFPYDTPEADPAVASVSATTTQSIIAATSESIPVPEPTESSTTESKTQEPISTSTSETPPAPTDPSPTEPVPTGPLPVDPAPTGTTSTDSPQSSEQPTTTAESPTEYQTLTKTITTTRLRTFTYVVTRVSGDEQYVTSSTTVKPHIKTTTVTEILPISSTQSAASSIGGRGLYVMEPRYNLATKVMANGVEVIVAGDKSTLPGSPLHRVIPSGLAKPITLAPSTLTDHMMMLLPHESQKPQNDFVTKTYMTTYTYLTTFAEGGSTVVSSRQKVVWNQVTEEVSPTRTQGPNHFTLASSPVLATGVYHTTYTYLNTLVDGERPLVATSKKTVTNTKTEQPLSTQPSPQPQDTNTYFSTVVYSKTLNDGDKTKVVKTEDVLTQVVITESDYIPSAVADKNRVNPTTTEVTKTYFATYTYFNTKVVDGSTVIKTEVATSSDVVAETFTVTPKKSSTSHVANKPSKVVQEPIPTNSITLYATKTYLTTFTYFTTLLQDNKSPSTIVKSRTKVQQNIVTEKVDDSLIDPEYLSILKSSVNDKHDSIVATATLNNGNKMEITAVASKLVNPTQSVSVDSSFGGGPSNVITGSTIIFFDDDVQPTPALESSFIEPTGEYAALTTQTPALVTATPAPSSASISTGSNTKITSPEDGDESMMVELTADPSTSSGGSSPVNNIFHGLNALGPVINAMADLFQNNFSGGKKKNETHIIYTPQTFPYQRPMITGNKDVHNTHVSPVYVPTYDSSDSEPAESQHVGGGNVFLDVNQRTKHGAERPSIEEALLSSGIPISPGQVITTNSDVIIGKHAVHGPRPPHKPFGKNDLVEGMKPPPRPQNQQPAAPPSTAHHTPSHNQQQSTPPTFSAQSKPGTSNKPVWPPRDQDRFASVPVPQRVPLSGLQDAPPLVPPPLRPQFVHHQKHPGKPPYHDHGSEEQKYSLQIDSPKESHVKPFKYYKNPALQRRPHDPPRKESNPNNHEPPYRGGPYKNEKNRQRPPKPTVIINREDSSNYDKTNHVNMSVAHQANPISHQSFSTTPAIDQTLLVNIQPSQVANVVIPHGLSTALIYSGSSEMPGQKGEIFNDATPYKDAEVGMVGVAGLSTSNGEATHVPSNAVRLDVPVSPQAVDIQSLQRPVEPNRRRPGQSYRPSANPLSEYMTPPPPPPTPHISTYVNYHLPKEPVEDQEGDYTVNNEFHASSEENKNGPVNHKPRPNWGSKINSGLVLPNSPTPFKYFTNYSNEPGNPGMQYSVINSKPVILGYDNTDKQPPIVKGKPGVTTFDNNDEATVSVGQPTNLAPADEIPTVIPTALSKQDNPSLSPPTSYDFKREKPLQNKPIYKSKPTLTKPVDNIKYAMNLDEKPPAPTFETPPHSLIYEIPTNIESASNSIGPDRNHGPQDESVVGLTPPAPIVNNPNVQERSTHRPPPATDGPAYRPAYTSRRPFPIRKRPPPPYKFEIPLSTAPSKPKKPSYQESVKPPTVNVPTEVLSPPKSTEQTYQTNEWKYTNKYNNDSHRHTPSVSINPVLGGSLKVEELAQKPELITADVKVPIGGNNVLTYNVYNLDRPAQETQVNIHQSHPNEVVNFHDVSADTPSPTVFSMSVENDSAYSESTNHANTRQPTGEVVNSISGRPTEQKHVLNANQHGSGGMFGMKVQPQGFQLSKDKHEHGSNVNYFTESDSVNDKTIKDSNRLPLEVQKVSPVTTDLYSPTPTPSSSFRPPEYDQIIVGSETVYLPDESVTSATPQINERPNTLVHFQQASTANMIKVTTGPTTQTYVTPVRSYENGHSVIPLQLKNRTSYDGFGGNKEKVEKHNVLSADVSAQPTTYVITHTQTLTVTTTESKIVQSKGQKPSTHTLVLTKTHTSTILDTVTEVHTLVKPTSIVQTVTTTIPQATTTIFPTKVQAGIEPTVTIEREPPLKAVVDDSDSILVVMTDKNSKNTLPHFNVDPSNEPQLEIDAPVEENEVKPNVLLGGFLSRSPENECMPDCKASRNERCQKINGVMRCVCRSGFARIFAERPCKPTYTFSMQVPLERVGKEKIRFTNGLTDASTSVYQHLAEATKEGLDRMVMQSDLRDVYHGLSVTGFDKNNNYINDTMAKFYIQLSENTDETKLEEVFRKHLKTNNFSMGGTELHASKEKLEFLRADDFDECTDNKFHDCSENAQCFNLRGTYTCSCREGFTDLSHNTLYPGRICSAEMIGCERCNFHGNCFSRESEEDLCECFQWYAGQYCQINLKVLLLILSLVGISLVVLLVVCLVLSCMRRRPLGGRGVSASQLRPPGFRLRPHQPQDKRAMISMDTSSEASMEHTPPPYIKQAVSLQSQVARPQKPCRKMSKAPSPPLSYHGTMEQRDRSLTVMIPRAKYRPVPAPGSNLTMSTFGPEQKLLKYLTVEKPQNSRSNSRKPSNSTTNSQETAAPKKLSHAQAPPPRKPSTGALVSAGFEVSATVGRTKEIQECFISEPHTDLNLDQGGFSTIRTADSSVLVEVPPPPTLEAELLDSSRVDFLTVSEARSYDETLIHPPTKSLRSNYDRNSEGHTMVERDTGSTFVLPQSQLYRPDRANDSDISNFDSL